MVVWCIYVPNFTLRVPPGDLLPPWWWWENWNTQEKNIGVEKKYAQVINGEIRDVNSGFFPCI
jgi:hypothetical protein